MKKLLFIIGFLFCALYSYCQLPNNQSVSNALTRYHIPNMKADSSIMFPIKDTLNNPATFYPGAMTVRPQDTIGHAIFPVYQSNGTYWSKVSSSIFITGLGIDSITLYFGQLCQWQGGTATCWFLTPGTGGSVDSFHLSPDSLAIYQYRNGAFIDSIYLLHTYLYVDNHFSLTPNYGGNPYAQLLNATRLIDTTYATPDSLYLITRYGDGDIDSTQWIGDGGGGGGGGGSGITALTGDITASGTGSVAATLATVNSNVGSFTNTSITVNGKGLITAASSGIPTADTLGFVHKLYKLNETITGRKLFNAAVFLNKDSTISSSGLSTVLVLDTTTNQVKRQESIIVSLSSVQNNDGLWYNSGTGQWNNAAIGTKAWTITGNSGMVWNTNFLGTTDAQSLYFKTNGVIGMKLDSNGVLHVDSFRIWRGPNKGFNVNSIGIGDKTLSVTTTGISNTAIGDSSLIKNTTGGFNTAVGATALEENTTGSFNTANGFQALLNNTTGNNNTALGYQSLKQNITTSSNSAFGFKALENNTASNNTAVGYLTMNLNTSGASNVAVGDAAMQTTSSANNSTAIGHGAGYGISSGNDNTAIGYFAAPSIGSGINNVAIGSLSLEFGTGNSNNAIGYSALYNTSTGINNVGVGQNALWANTTGSNNVAIGHEAGEFLPGEATLDSISNRSIYIGARTEPLGNNQTNQIVIGDSAIGLGSNTGIIGNTLQTLLAVHGNLQLLNIGNKLIIPTGTNASVGVSGAMTAGTITISTTSVTASSKIFLVHATIGGTQGILSVGTIVSGTSFVINSSNAADTGTVNWWVIN